MSIQTIPNEITEAKFVIQNDGVTVTGFPVDLSFKDGAIRFEPVFWENDSDVSLGDDKRSNIRAYDLRVSMNYQVSLEPTKLETILDELLNLINPDYKLYVSFDNGSNYFELIPTGGISLAIEFSDTIRLGGSAGMVPNFEFESRQYFKKLGDFFTTITL